MVRRSPAVWLLLLAVAFLCGCKAQVKVPSNPGTVDSSGPVGQPSDYFPTATGASWKYKITLSDKIALECREVRWPQGEAVIGVLTRGRFFGGMDKKKKEYSLVLTIKGPAKEQGPLQYPEGVELTAVTDDLGVFRDCNHIYWAITRSGGYNVTLLTTFSPDTPGAPSGEWGTWGGADGYAMREYFFGEKPGISIGIGKEPVDRLAFLGPEGDTLHFSREVKASEEAAKGETDSLSSAFTEDCFFKKGVGLTKLEQKVGGQTTMTWELVSFTPGN